MEQRELGRSGLTVSALGPGLDSRPEAIRIESAQSPEHSEKATAE